MNFEKLTIKNFLTVGEAEVEIANRGLLLIQGVNQDDPSAKSNGAGKSSIVDALCWCLYGVTARGITGDSVVNKTAKNNCAVSVSIEDGANKYLIERFRKSVAFKNQLLVWKLDPAGGPAIDMSKGTDKETQDVVNKVIGCTLDVFMAAVYCGQEAMPDLPGMTDKMLKTLIEEAAGVEELTGAYAIARNRAAVAKSQLDILTESLGRDNDNLTAHRNELATIRDSKAEFETGRKERAKLELAKTLPLAVEVKRHNEVLAALDMPAVAVELAKLQGELDGFKGEQAAAIALFAAAGVKEREVVRVTMQVRQASEGINKAKAALAAVDGKVGKPCGECGKAYHETDLCGVKALRETDFVAAQATAFPLVQVYKDAVSAEKAATAAATLASDALTDISALAARMRELRGFESAAASHGRDIASANAEIQRHKDAAKVMLTEANPWIKSDESKVKDIAGVETFIATKAAKMKAVKAESDLLTDAVKVFGPAGVRAHILDTVTPYLNDKTQDYLGALSDGNIHAVWSTLTKTAKGELREKFNIEVTNDCGAESFAGMSGGEKRKVRLACSMALQDMVASRATKPIGLWLGDEIDNALDESGLERLMGILERKARERGTVMVISHNSLSDWISNVITVTKKGGLATVFDESGVTP